MSDTTLDRALAAAANAARTVIEDELGDGAVAVFLFSASAPMADYPNAATLSAAFGGHPDEMVGAVLAQLAAVASDAAVSAARTLGVTVIEMPTPPSNN